MNLKYSQTSFINFNLTAFTFCIQTFFWDRITFIWINSFHFFYDIIPILVHLFLVRKQIGSFQIKSDFDDTLQWYSEAFASISVHRVDLILIYLNLCTYEFVNFGSLRIKWERIRNDNVNEPFVWVCFGCIWLYLEYVVDYIPVYHPVSCDLQSIFQEIQN